MKSKMTRREFLKCAPIGLPLAVLFPKDTEAPTGNPVPHAQSNQIITMQYWNDMVDAVNRANGFTPEDAESVQPDQLVISAVEVDE